MIQIKDFKSGRSTEIYSITNKRSIDADTRYHIRLKVLNGVFREERKN